MGWPTSSYILCAESIRYRSAHPIPMGEAISVTTNEGIERQNFIKVQSIYCQGMESLGLHRVHVEISDDETAIIRKVCYDQKADTLVGFCGPVRLDHTCTAHYRVKVREEVTGYNNIVQAFDNNVIGSYGRIIVINPLNPNLPKIPILVMPTCNTFTHELVQDRTHEIMKLFIEHIEPVWGPLIGPASDGDSCRRKFFLYLSRETEGNRFDPYQRISDLFICALSIVMVPFEISAIRSQSITIKS